MLFFIIFNFSACNNKVGNFNVLNNSTYSKEVKNTQETSVKVAPVEVEPETVEVEPVEEVKTEFEEKPKDNNDLNSLIPLGWGILIKDEPVIAEGDLNRDGIKDVAIIIEELKSETEWAPQRALLIAFGTKNDNDTYTLSIIADNIILPSDAGGVWGDPFESLSIDRGSVVISDYGGSNWRWYNTYRFRFQDDDWYLIGATMGEFYTGNLTGNEEDYNLLTGDYIFKEMTEGEMKITERGNRGKKQLIKLSEFDLNNM
jgi:hypothetical protein